MSKPKGGLGRGLAALIPTGPQTNVVSDVFMGGSSKRISDGTDAGDVDASTDAPTSAQASDAVASDGRAATQGAEKVRVDRTQSDAGSEPKSGSASAGDPAGPDAMPGSLGNEASIGDRDRSDTATDSGSDPEPTGDQAGPHRVSSPERATDRADGPRYEEVPIDRIRPNPRNPRTVFDEDSLTELEHSLREFGLLQPIVVREVDDGYELVMGERRWRAAERAGLTTIPAIIRRTEDANLLRDALLENIHRANLNPLEEAAAYQQLLQEFGVTQEELATRIGRSRPVISNTIRLLKLPIPVQRRVAAGVLSAGHARALLSLERLEDQEELATRVVAEGLSVRGTEEAVVLMAGRTTKARRTAPKKLVMPSLSALAVTLSDTFDTRVRVELGRQKGRVIVEFATVDDLERIVAIMAPGATEKRRNGSAPDQAS